MKTNVIFNVKKEETIQKEIIEFLKKAERSIDLAVAWLTDEDILRVLAQCSQDGITVRIVMCNSKENFKNTYKFKDLIRFHGQLFITTDPFMHHKFCVIDERVIINGSYNWSYTARTNEENILVLTSEDTDEDKLILKKFDAKFTYLINKCSVAALSMEILNGFRNAGTNWSVLLSNMDETEIQKRNEFEQAVQNSIEEARKAKIKLDYLGLQTRIQRDGGGVNFVKRLLNDEIQNHEMKSGFRKLEQQNPPRIELSLEYLVAMPMFRELFTSAEVNFCISLMQQYDINYN